MTKPIGKSTIADVSCHFGSIDLGSHVDVRLCSDARTFAEYTDRDIAMQLAAQSRDQLDPEYSAFLAAAGRRMEIAGRLMTLARKFLADNRVHVAEDIYQTDRVLENAPELIEAIADIVGYAPREG